MTRAFLIDVENDVIKEVSVGNDCKDFHKYINCRCFTVTSRKVGGKSFDVYCDDEGLLLDPQPPISAYSLKLNEPMLVGNLILANHDMEGNTTDLSDEDIKLIKENLIFATSPAKPKGYQLLACEY